MSYKLKFIPTALKEWKKLDNSVQKQFKKKLQERLEDPFVQSNHLSGFENHYKIKLKASGYRLVYEVIDEELYILVIAIGKRSKNSVYKKAHKRKRYFWFFLFLFFCFELKDFNSEFKTQNSKLLYPFPCTLRH